VLFSVREHPPYKTVSDDGRQSSRTCLPAKILRMEMEIKTDLRSFTSRWTKVVRGTKIGVKAFRARYHASLIVNDPTDVVTDTSKNS